MKSVMQKFVEERFGPPPPAETWWDSRPAMEGMCCCVAVEACRVASPRCNWGMGFFLSLRWKATRCHYSNYQRRSLVPAAASQAEVGVEASAAD
jgi:hypothetical protein